MASNIQKFLLTPREAAELLGVSVKWLYRRTKEGVLHPIDLNEGTDAGRPTYRFDVREILSLGKGDYWERRRREILGELEEPVPNDLSLVPPIIMARFRAALDRKRALFWRYVKGRSMHIEEFVATRQAIELELQEILNRYPELMEIYNQFDQLDQMDDTMAVLVRAQLEDLQRQEREERKEQREIEKATRERAFREALALLEKSGLPVPEEGER